MPETASISARPVRAHEHPLVGCRPRDEQPAPVRRAGDVAELARPAEDHPAAGHDLTGGAPLPDRGVGRRHRRSRTTRPVSASTTTVRPARSVYASRKPSPGQPRRRNQRHVPPQQAIARPVPGDDPQGRAAEVRDPRVDPVAGPAREANVGTGERPADVAVRLDRCQLVRARDDHEPPERRPRSLRLVAQPPLRAVGLDDPDAVGRFHEQPPRRRQREERRAARARRPPPRGSSRAPPARRAGDRAGERPRPPRARRRAPHLRAPAGSRSSYAARRRPRPPRSSCSPGTRVASSSAPGASP